MKDVLTRAVLELNKTKSRLGSILDNAVIPNFWSDNSAYRTTHTLTKTIDTVINDNPFIVLDPEINFWVDAQSIYLVKFQLDITLGDHDEMYSSIAFQGPLNFTSDFIEFILGSANTEQPDEDHLTITGSWLIMTHQHRWNLFAQYQVFEHIPYDVTVKAGSWLSWKKVY